jgi:hypothetical protein
VVRPCFPSQDGKAGFAQPIEHTLLVSGRLALRGDQLQAAGFATRAATCFGS